MPLKESMSDDKRLTVDWIIQLIMAEGIADGQGWTALMDREKATELAYDCVVGSMMQEEEQILKAKARYKHRMLGYAPCSQLCLNFLNTSSIDWCIDFYKDFTTKPPWKWLSEKKCIARMEFWTFNNQLDYETGKQEVKWNPHMHIYIEDGNVGKYFQAANRKYGKKFNVRKTAGHSNTKNYIIGNKAEGKQICLEADAKTRKDYDIPEFFPFYEFNYHELPAK